MSQDLFTCVNVNFLQHKLPAIYHWLIDVKTSIPGAWLLLSSRCITPFYSRNIAHSFIPGAWLRFLFQRHNSYFRSQERVSHFNSENITPFLFRRICSSSWCLATISNVWYLLLFTNFRVFKEIADHKFNIHGSTLIPWWNMVAPWLRRWLSTGRSWVRLLL